MLKLILIFVLNFFLIFSIHGVQKIHLGVQDINYYPLYGTYDGEDKKIGKFNGLIEELLDLYNKSQKDFLLIYEVRPIKRMYEEFLGKNSNLDAIFPDNPNWSTDIKQGKKLSYSLPVIDYTDGLFVLEENKNATLADIKVIGTLAGFSAFDYKNEIDSGKIKLEESFNTSSLIEKLAKKRVDYIYANKFIIQCKLAKLKLKNVLFSERLPHTVSHYYLSSEKFPNLIKSFNAFLIKNKNVISKINNSYINKCH